MSSKNISVLIVDDSAIFRNLWTKMLDNQIDIKVVATAQNGLTALEKIKIFKPDLILLDIEMPVMNGLETLSKVKQDYPHIKIIIASSLSLPSSDISIQCLTMGASDYVTKPNQNEIKEIEQILLNKIRSLFHIPVLKNYKKSTQKILTKKIEAIVIGSSTGGPNALTYLLNALSPEITVPILIAQHMPPMFTKTLAEKFDKETGRRAYEAQAGQVLDKNSIYIAPGDFHMNVVVLAGRYTISLNQKPKENFCRPAVDPLFRTAAEVFGANVLALVLTGMGHDGLAGATVLKQKGAAIVVQDQASSVVWGMPGAIAEAGIADFITPLKEIPALLLDVIKKHN